MSLKENGSAAVATATPRSAVRASLLLCADRLGYVGQLATIAAETGRTRQGALYIVDELNDLAGDIARLRAFIDEPETSTQ